MQDEGLSFDNKLSGTAEFSLRLYFCNRGEGFFLYGKLLNILSISLILCNLEHHVKENATMKLTGAQIIMECLLEQHVDTVFGYPGGAVLNIYDALYEYSDRINHICTAHEQGAAHAADGYARSSGKTGVCIATSGPGATN